MSINRKRVGDVVWHSSNKHSLSLLSFDSTMAAYKAVKSSTTYGYNDIVSFSNSQGKTANTWEDWGLISEGPIIFATPKPKTSYFDLAGGNGSIAVSSFGKETYYANRTGTLDFIFDRSIGRQPGGYFRMYETIVNWLHGKKCLAIAEDDPNYIYEGEFQVDSIRPGEDFYTLRMSYNLHPFKSSLYAFGDRWLWDPFNFKEKTPIPTYVSDNIDYGLESAELNTVYSELARSQNLLLNYTPRLSNGGQISNVRMSSDNNYTVELGEFESEGYITPNIVSGRRRYVQIGCCFPYAEFSNPGSANIVATRELELSVVGMDTPDPQSQSEIITSSIMSTSKIVSGTAGSGKCAREYLFSVFDPNMYVGASLYKFYKFKVRYRVRSSGLAFFYHGYTDNVPNSGYVTINYRARAL